MSAGSKLLAARQRIEELELQLARGSTAAAAPARSLLRQLLPFARHRVECDRVACDCGLEELRDTIDELLES